MSKTEPLYIKEILPNGLRIVLIPEQSNRAATVLVLVEAGSEYETKEINGLSHFLEHMCFKGTTKRPVVGVIAEELDALGAEYNAFTGQEYTGYWAKAEHKKLPELIDLVSDLYLNPLFRKEEIEKERGVIIGEINMNEDTPTRKIHDILLELLYGDQPAGWDIAGTIDNIKRLSQDDFLNYRAKHYIASATTVVIAGAFDPKVILQTLHEKFGGLTDGEKQKKPIVLEEQREPQVVIRKKALDQSHLVLGVRTFDMFDDRRFALEVLENVLGGGMSSRLFKKIREELGAAYYVSAGSDLSLDHGYIAIAAGVHHEKRDEVISAICAELRRLKSELVPPRELEKSKDHIIGNMMLGLETSDSVATFYGFQELLRKELHDPEEFAERIRRVTAEEVQELAKQIFKQERANLALLSNDGDPIHYRALLSI